MTASFQAWKETDTAELEWLHISFFTPRDCFASLAMTGGRLAFPAEEPVADVLE
jgi:hypothetical protein